LRRLQKSSEGFGGCHRASEGFGGLHRASEGFIELQRALESFRTSGKKLVWACKLSPQIKHVHGRRLTKIMTMYFKIQIFVPFRDSYSL